MVVLRPSKLLLAAIILAPSAQGAEAPSIARAYTWSADVLNSDFRSESLQLSGNVRVAQGELSIEAQSATATNFRSDNSEWVFKNSVRIHSAQADLTSDAASASFAKGQIATARAQGAPAQFQQNNAPAGAQVRGRAQTIDYDFVSGTVRLNGDVWFSNGKDEFRGDVVIYDIRQERVQINPGGQSPGRVQGVIRPRASAEESTPSGGDGA